MLETEAEELSKASQSPLGNIRRKHYILTPRQSEKAFHITATSKPKKSKLGGIGKTLVINININNTNL